jgi:hypothetical protein
VLDRRGETKGRACTGTAVQALRKGEGDDSRGPLDVGREDKGSDLRPPRALPPWRLRDALPHRGPRGRRRGLDPRGGRRGSLRALARRGAPGPGDAGQDRRRRVDAADAGSPAPAERRGLHDARRAGDDGALLRAGAAAYFPKSAEMGELVEAVRDAARLRSPGRQAGPRRSGRSSPTPTSPTARRWRSPSRARSRPYQAPWARRSTWR